jgi:hypothetical protein
MKKMKKNKRERASLSPPRRPSAMPPPCAAQSSARPSATPLAHSRARSALLAAAQVVPPRGPALLPPLDLSRPTSPLSPLGCLHAWPSSRSPFPGRQAKSAQRPGRAPSPFSRVHAATRAHAAPHASVGAPSRRQEHCSSFPNRTKRFSRPQRHFCAHISRFSLSTSRTQALPPSIFPAPVSRSLPTSSRRRGTQPARRPAVRPSQPPLLHPRRGQPARVRASSAQPARRPTCAVARPCTQARQCLQASPPLHTCPSVAVRVPLARPCACVRRGPHVCPRCGLRVVGVPAARSRVPGATSRASCVTPVCRRCHRRPCPQQPRRNLRSVATASPSLRVVRAARPRTSPRARPVVRRRRGVSIVYTLVTSFRHVSCFK